MRELDPRYGALFSYEAGDGSKSIGMGIAPDAAVARADTPLRAYRGCLDHYHPGATHGTASEMNEMPVSGQPVVTGILAHGG
jgi:hypothetical protein